LIRNASASALHSIHPELKKNTNREKDKTKDKPIAGGLREDELSVQQRCIGNAAPTEHFRRN